MSNQAKSYRNVAAQRYIENNTISSPVDIPVAHRTRSRSAVSIPSAESSIVNTLQRSTRSRSSRSIPRESVNSPDSLNMSMPLLNSDAPVSESEFENRYQFKRVPSNRSDTSDKFCELHYAFDQCKNLLKEKKRAFRLKKMQRQVDSYDESDIYLKPIGAKFTDLVGFCSGAQASVDLCTCLTCDDPTKCNSMRRLTHSNSENHLQLLRRRELNAGPSKRSHSISCINSKYCKKYEWSDFKPVCVTNKCSGHRCTMLNPTNDEPNAEFDCSQYRFYDSNMNSIPECNGKFCTVMRDNSIHHSVKCMESEFYEPKNSPLRRSRSLEYFDANE